MYFRTQFSPLVILTNAQGQTLVSSRDQRIPSVRRGLSESTGPYSDGEGRYPIIAPIGPFIFCLHSRERAAWEGTNQIALCNNLQCWINHMNFTRSDRYFTSSSRVPFLSCSCPSVGMLISVMKYLISHKEATKRRLGGFHICLEIIKMQPQHQVQSKKQNLTRTTFFFPAHWNSFKMSIDFHMFVFQFFKSVVDFKLILNKLRKTSLNSYTYFLVFLMWQLQITFYQQNSYLHCYPFNCSTKIMIQYFVSPEWHFKQQFNKNPFKLIPLTYSC